MTAGLYVADLVLWSSALVSACVDTRGESGAAACKAILVGLFVWTACAVASAIP